MFMGIGRVFRGMLNVEKWRYVQQQLCSHRAKRAINKLKEGTFQELNSHDIILVDHVVADETGKNVTNEKGKGGTYFSELHGHFGLFFHSSMLGRCFLCLIPLTDIAGQTYSVTCKGSEDVSWMMTR